MPFPPGNVQRLATAMTLILAICSHCIHAEFHKSPIETAVDEHNLQSPPLADQGAFGDDDNYPVWKDPLFREKSARQFADIFDADSSTPSASTFDFFTDSSQDTTSPSYCESDPSWPLASTSSLASTFSSSSSEGRPAPYKRVQYQRKWCPGEALLRILEDARLPIYQWVAEADTCSQFSRNFGDIGVTAYFAGTIPPTGVLCVITPIDLTTYCAFRSFSINEPVYQNVVLGSSSGVTPDANFAVACTTLYLDDGYVVTVCISAPVSRLPDVC